MEVCLSPASKPIVDDKLYPKHHDMQKLENKIQAGFALRSESEIYTVYAHFNISQTNFLDYLQYFNAIHSPLRKLIGRDGSGIPRKMWRLPPGMGTNIWFCQIFRKTAWNVGPRGGGRAPFRSATNRNCFFYSLGNWALTLIKYKKYRYERYVHDFAYCLGIVLNNLKVW